MVEVVAPPPMRKHYFINEQVEWQLTKYIWTGCTEVELRDKIMSHATELIRQIIRKQRLHVIYPGQEESAFGDLLQTAWVQIERTLYKYRARPHCRRCYNNDRPSDSLLYQPASNEYGIITMAEVISKHKFCPKCKTKFAPEPIIEPVQGTFGGSETIIYRGMSKVFNMWSQVARTVILAYIKKEGRDRRNSNSYMSYLGGRQRPINDIIRRFLNEAREICRFHEDYLQIITAIEQLAVEDERPHDGIIGKLVLKTGLSRQTITSFMRIVKLRSFEFTDSPINKHQSEESRYDNRRQQRFESDEE